MRFTFGKQDLRTIERARESLFMRTNGLGGYLSVSAGYSVSRCDQILLTNYEPTPGHLKPCEAAMYLINQ